MFRIANNPTPIFSFQAYFNLSIVSFYHWNNGLSLHFGDTETIFRDGFCTNVRPTATEKIIGTSILKQQNFSTRLNFDHIQLETDSQTLPLAL